MQMGKKHYISQLLFHIDALFRKTKEGSLTSMTFKQKILKRKKKYSRKKKKKKIFKKKKYFRKYYFLAKI